jgi:hypothetical protein
MFLFHLNCIDSYKFMCSKNLINIQFSQTTHYSSFCTMNTFAVLQRDLLQALKFSVIKHHTTLWLLGSSTVNSGIPSLRLLQFNYL